MLWKMATEEHQLPEDEMFQILARLPVKSLIRFSSVFKSFQSIIREPCFISKHLSWSNTCKRSVLVKYTSGWETCLSLLNPELQLSDFFIPALWIRKPFMILAGSFNGIICMVPNIIHYTRIPILLWNIATRKYRELPDSVDHGITRGNMECCDVSHGFGYYSTSADYKVVKIIAKRENLTTISLAEVFSLKVGRWREVAELDCTIVSKSATVTYQTMNWLVTGGRPVGREKIQYFDMRRGSCTWILTFVMETEQFTHITLPEFGYVLGGHGMKLSVHEDTLHLIKWYPNLGEAKDFDIWFLKQVVDENRWAKKFGIRQSLGIEKPLGFGWKGELLMEKNKGRLVSYDTSSEDMIEIPIKNYTNPLEFPFKYSLDVVLYTETLCFRLLRNGNGNMSSCISYSIELSSSYTDAINNGKPELWLQYVVMRAI